MEVVRETGAVVAVLGLLLFTLWWLRKRGYAATTAIRKRSGRRMECLDRLSLGPQQTLHLVRLGDSALLIAASPSGCALLHSLPQSQIERPEVSR